MPALHHVLKAPCKSCPYRKDVPSGVWAPEEYVKLPEYDGEVAEQAMKGGTSLFLCHQQDNSLCAGWLGCHGPENLFAMRFHHRHVLPETFDYTTDVPLFSSGREAAEHGLREVETPSERANRVMAKLAARRRRKS